VQMHPCVWHLPYKPQFELYVGLSPTSTVNESYGVVTAATFPLLRGRTQVHGFFGCCFSRREGPGLWGNPDSDRTFDVTLDSVCRRETILIRASVPSVSLEVITHLNEFC
jgi:hypothetical protein